GRVEITLADGWSVYRQALDLVGQGDWAHALTLLAQAETTFHTADDCQGLWRALIGQSLLHWRDGATALAIARAMAALRAAEIADDGFAFGCVAWQVANMMIGQGEYRKAADYLDQAQLALDAVNLAPGGGALAAAARLCVEIGRWHQMCERAQIGAREAEAAIAEVQEDLLVRLNQAAASMRSASLDSTHGDTIEGLLLPGPPTMLAMPHTLAPAISLSGWLSRVWRRLIHGDDALVVEPLTRVAMDAPIGMSEQTLPQARDTQPIARDLQLNPLPALVSEIDQMATVFNESTHTPDPIELVMAEPATTDTMRLAPMIATVASAMASDPPDSPPALATSLLKVHLFGQFRVTLNGHQIISWPSGRGRAVFKYLLAHRERPIPRDTLMEIFWPDASPESARNSLNVALHGLRQALRVATDLQVIVFKNGVYRFTPDLPIWLDVDEFRRHVQSGRRLEDAGSLSGAAAEYEQAIVLYEGDLMADDLADDWPVLTRERLRVAYLDTLDRLSHIRFSQEQYDACVALCQLLLTQDSCREDAHCRLIRCYSRLGQHHLALRQYQECVKILRDELDIDPSPTTTQLCEQARRRELL
ncbi:MAG TPA: BTAD domain-containing putative transcriptional regulator, partial [Roseiflexaceae bacterium]|nr:BTAD domain-containing putative transcriptional regulator [Roseiflexaceae bacterium]